MRDSSKHNLSLFKIIIVLLIMILVMGCIIPNLKPPSSSTTKNQAVTLQPNDAGEEDNTQNDDSSQNFEPTGTPTIDPNIVFTYKELIGKYGIPNDHKNREITFETSLYSGDSRIWIDYYKAGRFLSNDHGTTWKFLFPTPNDYFYTISPTHNSFSLQTNTEMFNLEGHSWKKLGASSPNKGNWKYYSDPSGNLNWLALGTDPNGKDNAWLFSDPDGKWRDISTDIDDWEGFSGGHFVWSAKYGVFAENQKNSILHADNNFHWEKINNPADKSFFHLWEAEDGEIYIGSVGLEATNMVYHWTGSDWEETPGNDDNIIVRGNTSVVNLITTPDGIMSHKIIIPGKATIWFGKMELSFSDKSRYLIHLTGSSSIDDLGRPPIPERMGLPDYSAGGDGSLYAETPMGLYYSLDLGKTWVEMGN